MNGGSSTSGITNSVTNVVNRGNGDSSYNGILSTMSITSLTYILGAMMAIVTVLIVVGLVQYVIGSFVSLGLIQYNLDLIDGKDVEFGQIFSKASMSKSLASNSINIAVATPPSRILFLP